MNKIRFEVGLDHAPEARALREEIFIREQGFSCEFDEIDKEAFHIIICDDETPVATGRIFGHPDELHIGRIAVKKSARGKKLGNLVMSELEFFAKSIGGQKIVLSAQVQARGFYEKLGYTATGEVYLDEHCPHIDMFKLISRKYRE